MLGLFKNRRASRTAGAFCPAVEQLESRQMLSANIPGDYLKVGELSISAKTTIQSAAKSFALQEGTSYWLKASCPNGPITMGPNGRLGDAEFFDIQDPALRGDQREGRGDFGIRIGGVSFVDGGDGNYGDKWGDYEDSHVYTMKVVGGSTPMTAFFMDSNYTDNGGSLKVEIFEQVTLNSFTATDALYSAQTATATGSDPVTLEVDPVYADSGSESEPTSKIATVNLTGMVSPATTAGYAKTLYELRNPAGTLIQHGTFSPNPIALTMDWTDLAPDNTFELIGGVDADGSGDLQLGEVRGTILMQRKPLFFNYALGNVPGTSMTNRLATPAGATTTFDSVKVTDSTGATVVVNLAASATVAGTGAPAAGFVATFGKLASGTYRVSIGVAGTVPAGDYDLEVYEAGVAPPLGNGVPIRLKV